MKKLFFSLLAFAATMSTSAQIVSGTDYLIQNVKTGYYFGGGRDYGTHGTLLAKPQFFTFTTNGSGYSLDSHQYNNASNHFLGTNLYVDGGATAWNVVETSTPGVYTIENSGNYLAGNGFNANIKTVTDANDADAQWKLISKADALAAAGEGTLENPSNATVLIKNPEIKRNASTSWYSTWTITNYAGNGTPGNFAQGGGAAVANCAESYMSNNGFKATQTITEGVKAGVYRLDAQGFYQQRASNANVPSIYLNDQSAVLPFNSATSGSMAGAYSDMLANRWPTEPLYVRVEEGGSLTITVSSDVSSCWTIFGEMSLTYYGDCTVNQAQNVGIVKEWKAYVATKDEVAETLDAAGKSSYNTAKAGIETPTSSEALTTAKAALDAALRAAALAQTTAGADMTLAIANPSFETGDTKGWTIEGNGGAWVMMTRANATDPKVGDYWIEKYGWSGKIDVNQTLSNLHKGHYRVSVLTLDQASKAKLIAESNGATVETPVVGGDKAVYTLDIMLDDNSDLKIGVYCENHNANSWVGIDDFHLTFVSDEFPALPEAVTGKMNATVAAAQAAAIEAYEANKTVANYNAAAAAIAAAQNSKAQYEAAAVALTAQKALMDATNVYAAEGFKAYQTAWTTNNDKYENNTLTNEDGVVNPTAATGWRASTAYNFLLAPWTIGGEACNNFDKALYINTWSIEGNSDGSNFTTPFFEYWVADGQNLAANTISTTLGVENGLYEVSALVRASHNADDVKAVNLTVNEGDAVNVADGAQIGTTNRYMNTFTAQGLVKDGKLTIAFDVPAESKISWFCFKNVKYTKVRDLTPEEEIVYATAEQIEAFNAAVEAAEAKTVGFQKGNYSPYTNAEAIKALADAKAINTEEPVDLEVINAAISAIADENWTVNAKEVNAINNGDLEGTYAEVSGSGVSSDRAIYLPEGWNFRKNGIDKNDIIILQSGDKADNNFSAMTALDNGDAHTLKYRGKWGTTTNIDFYQKITLPAGKYVLSCDAWKSGLGGDGKIYVGASNEASLDGNEASWRKLSLTFTLEEEKTIEVGFNIKHTSDGSEKFIGFDNFELYSAPVEAELTEIQMQEMPNPWTGDMTTYVVGSDAEGNEFTFIFAEGEYVGASLYTAEGDECDASEGTATFAETEDGKALEATVTFTDYADFEKTYHVTGLVPYATANMAVNAEAKWGTFVAPFNVAIPEGVTAYVVGDAEGATLVMTDITEMGVDYIPAYTPVLLSAEEGLEKTTVKGFTVPREDDEPIEYGLLSGVLTKTAATVGSYILQNNNNKVGFYKVANDGLFVGANRCYLTKSESSVKAFFFDEETAIKAIDALTSGKAEIYDLNGRKLQKLQKGINIVNGVKVMVK